MILKCMVGITFFFLSPGKEKQNYEGFVVCFYFFWGGGVCFVLLGGVVGVLLFYQKV